MIYPPKNQIIFSAKSFHGLLWIRQEMLAFRLTFSCLMVTRSFVLKKQKKNTRHPITPKIIITIRNPSASFPFPNLSTRVRANALTTVKGYYIDKDSVCIGIHSPEYYGYGFMRYILVQLDNKPVKLQKTIEAGE